MTPLVAALRETAVLIARSEDPAFSHWSVHDILEALAANVAALEADGTFQRETLSLLFAPTGPIQETAIDNGWSDAYMRLSAEVDRYTAER